MARLLFGLGIAAVIFMVYAVADCAFFDRSRIRGLPRGWWIVVIILVPIIGGLLWFIVGRGRANRRPASRGSRTVAPDDDADFLRRLGTDAAQEERIRRLEQELADLDDDPDDDAQGSERKRPDAPEAGDAGPAGRPNA